MNRTEFVKAEVTDFVAETIVLSYATHFPQEKKVNYLRWKIVFPEEM